MRAVWIILGLLLALWLVSGLTMVQPGERAVIQRFGRVLSVKPEPGLHLGLPWGIDRIDRVPVELLRPVTVGFTAEEEEAGAIPAGQLLTGDHNLVNVRLELNYTVRATEVERYVVHADRIDGLIARAAEAVLAEWVAARTVDDVLLRGKQALPNFVVTRARQRLEPYRLGIELRDARVTHLFPPGEVKDSFDEVARAQTEMATKQFAAQEDSARLLGQVDAENFAVLRQATGYAAEQRLEAEADAGTFARHADQFQRLRLANPRYLEGLWFERLNPVLAKMKAERRIQPLDAHLGGRQVDITQIPPLPKKR